MGNSTICTIAVAIALIVALPGGGFAQVASPSEQAEQAAREAFARAAAEKARNDQLVIQQRLEQERNRLEQERRVRDWEEYERRKNAG